MSIIISRQRTAPKSALGIICITVGPSGSKNIGLYRQDKASVGSYQLAFCLAGGDIYAMIMEVIIGLKNEREFA